MAITIRNKTTEDLIRKIGRRTGEGPSAVIRRLAENENRNAATAAVPEEEVQRRFALIEELGRKYPPPDPSPTREEINADIDAMYSYLYEDAPGKPAPRHKP